MEDINMDPEETLKWNIECLNGHFENDERNHRKLMNDNGKESSWWLNQPI